MNLLKRTSLLLAASVLFTGCKAKSDTKAEAGAPEKPLTVESAPKSSVPVINATGTWTAASSTAMGVTGDIGTSPSSLVFMGYQFPLHLARAYDKAGIKNAAALFPTNVTPQTTASLVRVDIPATQKLKSDNTLCGAQAVTWAVLVNGKGTLDIAMFSGHQEPDLRPEVVKNSGGLCGTYSYTQQGK